ncbi:patatin-like phospholipase family protein [Leptolinea tardivitalis]|uniref:Patatin n=1 Tax=Leptolinea tardivitalis TaxID=229920 RepID=A0A0P6X7V9_9CHLR|nr:patatin-like phospholipase family protein [Leptolinea tardivitalis]KPL70263.1 patatin [Leptolinea tardivitalis]GAP21814.1 predicted esterase of the alpha-beta hydrolase superfamily [Leptolinea tardivitalis]
MAKWDSSKKVGLALGGGVVLGAAHVGVLRAIHELGIKVDIVTGTSIGAFVAALYAFDKSWDQIEQIAMDLEWIDTAGLALSQYGLLSNQKLGVIVRNLIGDVKFSDSKIKLGMVASDVVTGERVKLTRGNVAEGVMASSCIPGVFNPVHIKSKLLIDGGLLENVPIMLAREMGAETIIAVDLFTASHSHRAPDNLVDLLLNTYYSAMINAARPYNQYADWLITPDLSEFNLLNTDQIPALIHTGYRTAMKMLSESH